MKHRVKWGNRKILMFKQRNRKNRLVIVAKTFLKLPNLHKLIKQKNPSLPRNLAPRYFDEWVIVFSTKVNLLYLLYSTARRCCLLHLIKQNFPEDLLKTPILMTTYLFVFFLLELIFELA